MATAEKFVIETPPGDSAFHYDWWRRERNLKYRAPQSLNEVMLIINIPKLNSEIGQARLDRTR